MSGKSSMVFLGAKLDSPRPVLGYFAKESGMVFDRGQAQPEKSWSAGRRRTEIHSCATASCLCRFDGIYDQCDRPLAHISRDNLPSVDINTPSLINAD